MKIPIIAKICKQGNNLFVKIPRERLDEFEHRQKVIISEINQNGE